MLQRFRDKIVNVWVAGGIIGLIAITFVFWGVDFNLSGASFAARVDGEEISMTEFDREFQNELFEYQQTYQTDIDDELRRELRRNVLERMVGTRALQQRVRSAGYRVSDERLTEHIRSMPSFQADGRFSLDIYRAQLRFQGYSPAGFEHVQRAQLELMELRNGIFDSTFMTPSEFRRYIELYNQEREIGYALFEAENFIEEVDVTDEAVAAHYNANRERYRTAEAVDLEYIEVRRADIAAEVDVTEEMLRDYYERERNRFEITEERRARHILIAAGAGDEAAARERAEQVMQRLEAGEDFAELAAELSDDTGTRAAGGDLGWITPGMLSGAFEDALYAMDVGEIEGPVRTNFGFHIIRLDNLREGDVQSFDVLRDELYEEYRLDLAEGRYYDLANELVDRAFDAYDELASVAAEMELPLRTLAGFTRAGADEFPNSAPVVQAAFSRDVLEDRLNSRLIELGDDHVLVLRVREHYPPAEQPLDDVYDDILEELTWMQARELAREAAEGFYNEAAEDAQAFALLIDQAPTVESESADTAPSAAASAAEEVLDDVPGDVAAADAEAVDRPGAPGDGPADDEDVAAETPPVDDAQRADDQADDQADDDAAGGAVARLQELAARHRGSWDGPRWVARSNPGMPTQVIARAFALPRHSLGEEPVREQVPLADGDQAVLFVSGFRPGVPDSIPQGERDFVQRQLAEQAAVVDLLGYAGQVRDKARVRIPDGVLEDPEFFID